MPDIVYKAIDLKGQELSDTLTASSRAMVVDQLVEKGLYPVSVDERRESTSSGAGIFSRTGYVSKSSVEAFTRELANLLTAGVPLSKALSILTHEAAQPAAKKQWAAIHEDTMGGMFLRCTWRWYGQVRQGDFSMWCWDRLQISALENRI